MISLNMTFVGKSSPCDFVRTKTHMIGIKRRVYVTIPSKNRGRTFSSTIGSINFRDDLHIVKGCKANSECPFILNFISKP